jgi:AbrB family looped-hinge helix DNA binding protein
MESIDITSVSSRGQVVIPQRLRNRMNIRTGERFAVIGEDNTIILKKLEMPSFQGIDKLLASTRDFVQKSGIKPSDVEGAIKRARK